MIAICARIAVLPTKGITRCILFYQNVIFCSVSISYSASSEYPDVRIWKFYHAYDIKTPVKCIARKIRKDNLTLACVLNSLTKLTVRYMYTILHASTFLFSKINVYALPHKLVLMID